MTRNEAINLMNSEIERAQALGQSLQIPGAGRSYFYAYQDAVRNLTSALASAGAFEDGRNMDARLRSRVNYKG